jgi:hypothetical protein
LAALFIFFHAIGAIEQFAPSAFLAMGPRDAMFYKFISYQALAIIVVDIVFGVLLLAKTETFVNFLAPSRPEEDSDMAFSTGDLAIVSFSLAGLFFAVKGAEGLIMQIATISMRSEFSHGNYNLAGSLLGSLFKLAVGLWLLMSAGGVVRCLRWAREAGATGPRS